MSDDAPLPSIDEVRAAYVRDSLLAPRGMLVDVIIDGTREERRLVSARVDREPVCIVADSRAWTWNVATSALRRVIVFLFGSEALGDHAPEASQ